MCVGFPPPLTLLVSSLVVSPFSCRLPWPTHSLLRACLRETLPSDVPCLIDRSRCPYRMRVIGAENPRRELSRDCGVIFRTSEGSRLAYLRTDDGSGNW